MDYEDADRRMLLEIYFDTQDDFWPYRLWPRWARQAILLRHKNNRDRYRLFLFFCYNGLFPPTAVEWIRAIGIDGSGKLLYGQYDAEAWRHFRQLLNLSRQRSFYEQARNIFDMETRTIVSGINSE